ncbi:MAG: hypothetical protein KZQ95_05915 [Candidatus Thiodiazotropha sp. (ex Epidulcina cf. delphinae)]|nr:hypothetical protein [Candidatus Thiodiazotropha sp. (ex Epidulcina cf. delphinae)]
MDRKLLDEIIACLPKDRTLFRYARNDYALMLLSRYVSQGMKISDLRRSPFGRLLEKPAIRNLMAGIGNGCISGDLFDYVYVKDRQDFLLTVGRWNEGRSRYNQTSRNNENLVLQLNFSRGHDGEFERLVGRANAYRFKCGGHPILEKGERDYYRHTMAWVRMDVDFAMDEILIEEVQTDWLRYAKRYLRSLMRCDGCQLNCERKERKQRILQALKDYVERVLMPYSHFWDEAALMAAIQFAVDELGVQTIYYHTFDTGNVLKGMWNSHPPRSLYTDLPRKFCFELTDEAPRMFDLSTAAKRKLRKARDPHWYRLNMEVRQ